MKKVLVGMLLAAVGICSLPAGNDVKTCEKAAVPAATAPAAASAPSTCAAPVEWDFFQLGLWFDVPSSMTDSLICGIKVGAPFCAGKGTVNGLETAVFCGATDNINGLQACVLASVSKQVDGMQFSIVNYTEKISGLQLGVVNVAKKRGLQLGLVNYIEDGVVPFMIIANWKF